MKILSEDEITKINKIADDAKDLSVLFAQEMLKAITTEEFMNKADNDNIKFHVAAIGAIVLLLENFWGTCNLPKKTIRKEIDSLYEYLKNRFS